MKSVNEEITEAFFAYLRDRNISDETKFAWFEKQRVETGIDYVDYYNGLIDWAGKFLMEFEELHREEKRDMYLTKRFTREQVEEVLTDENLGIPLSQYTNGKLSGYYYYNEAKKDKLFFQVAIKDAHCRDVTEAYNNVKELIKEIKEKAATEPQPSNGNCPRLKTKSPRLNRGQLEALYGELIEGGYISYTEKDLFVWLFGGDIKPQQFTPIKWVKNKTLLVYLIDCICYDPTVSFNYWKNAEMIFEQTHMAQSKNNYMSNKNTEGKPGGYKEIDSIISKIKEV